MTITVIRVNGEAQVWTDVRPVITDTGGLELRRDRLVMVFYTTDSWESFVVTRTKEEPPWRRVANELAAALRLGNEMRDRALEEFKKASAKEGS